MSPYLSELLGTAVLVYFGNTAVANVLLRRTNGNGAGWIVIATGYAMGIFVGIWVAAASGGHLNPAVTVAMWAHGKLAGALVPGYIAAQFAGAMAGAALVWLQYLPHWGQTESQAAKLGCFATAPAIRAPLSNLISELLATFFFVFGILMLVDSPWQALAPVTDDAARAAADSTRGVLFGAAPWSAFAIACLFWGIALGPGGTTGFAVNPARDLGPRFMHAILPVAGKGGSDWGYAWVPVVGPILGGLAAVALHGAIAVG